MMFNVPQFIDVEDKIAGPLTWRQILWMIGMGAVLMILYGIFNTATFFILAIPVIIVFALFAFYRPNGISMIEFVMHGFLFLFQPKVAVWERPVNHGFSAAREPEKIEEVAPQSAIKKFDGSKVHQIAEILDQHK
ncbi:MAG: PrgI family protein [Candidatus Moranbacteria bacterium]|nr:PrgI family protein [Candidatus Moranbacteria bacterium]